MNDLGLYLFIFILAVIALIGNVAVIYSMVHSIQTFQAIMTRLVLLLHLSAIAQSIGSLPYIYTGNFAICEMMGALHYYFGLVIIGVDICLTILYYNYLILDHTKLEGYLSHYSINIILLCSMISFLPLTTRSYGINNEVWCSLSYYQREDNIWAFCTFYLWAFLACFFCVSLFTYTVRFGKEVRRDLFLSAVAYVLVTFIQILPRLIPRVFNLFIDFTISFDAQFFIQACIYLSLVLYVACYYRNREMLKQYELQKRAELQDPGFVRFTVSYFMSFWSGKNESSSDSSLFSRGIEESKVTDQVVRGRSTIATSTHTRPTLNIISNPIQANLTKEKGKGNLQKDDMYIEDTL